MAVGVIGQFTELPRMEATMCDRSRLGRNEHTAVATTEIDRRELLLNAGSLVAATALATAGLADPAQAQQNTVAGSKPNIVVILAADLGSVDLGYRGSDIQTPHIDRLAHEGVRLESCYGLPLSTPARAALMTGRYPMRHGLQTLVIFPSHTYGLPTDEYTLPQALKDAGYRTAMVGKWHLGHADEKFWPQRRGFDHFYGSLVGEVDYFAKDRGGLVDWQRNGKFFREDGYATTQLGDEAVKLIEQHDESAPLFLYFASLAPQAPFQAPQPTIDAYGLIRNEARRTYAAMITELDNQVGRIVAALEKKGMRQNTLIFFTTDNGGATNPRYVSARSGDERKESVSVVPDETSPASNGKFRSGKGSLYEGGVRVPAIVNWPGRLDPRVVNEPLHHVDLMPTLLALAGSSGRADRLFDGRDIWASLADGAPSPHQDILINVEPARGGIRKGNWKLVKFATLPGRTELFDLVKDPGEQTNLASQNQSVVRQLEARLMDYARQQKPAEWIKAQPQLVSREGKTVFDPDFVLEDSGLPHERAAIPGALTEGRAVAPADER
jgi:arylsulfatase A-like enzyme